MVEMFNLMFKECVASGLKRIKVNNTDVDIHCTIFWIFLKYRKKE